MENYRKSAHCTYDIKYHLVWITKYRKPVITGQIAMYVSGTAERVQAQKVKEVCPSGVDICQRY